MSFSGKFQLESQEGFVPFMKAIGTYAEENIPQSFPLFYVTDPLEDMQHLFFNHDVKFKQSKWIFLLR